MPVDGALLALRRSRARSPNVDNKSFARIAVWILVAVVLFTVFRQFDTVAEQTADTTSYTQFMDDAKEGKIKRVDIQGRRITVTPQSVCVTLRTTNRRSMISGISRNSFVQTGFRYFRI